MGVRVGVRAGGEEREGNEMPDSSRGKGNEDMHEVEENEDAYASTEWKME